MTFPQLGDQLLWADADVTRRRGREKTLDLNKFKGWICDDWQVHRTNRLKTVHKLIQSFDLVIK